MFLIGLLVLRRTLRLHRRLKWLRYTDRVHAAPARSAPDPQTGAYELAEEAAPEPDISLWLGSEIEPKPDVGRSAAATGRATDSTGA